MELDIIKVEKIRNDAGEFLQTTFKFNGVTCNFLVSTEIEDPFFLPHTRAIHEAVGKMMKEQLNEWVAIAYKALEGD